MITTDTKIVAHNRRSGRKYYKGDIVESMKDMCEVKKSDGNGTYFVRRENLVFHEEECEFEAMLVVGKNGRLLALLPENPAKGKLIALHYGEHEMDHDGVIYKVTVQSTKK